MSQPRILFAGTPDFALASLRALVESDRVPIAVLTQPDRPAGRGKKLRSSPVKKYALEQDIPVMQPATLRDEAVVAELTALQPDIMIVAAYGLLLPQSVLDIPTAGCLNVHASLLPRWRGAAPIQAAILAGDERSGVCLMAMEAGLDCGAVYAHAVTPIAGDDTAGDLHDRLAVKGGELLVKHLDAIIDGGLQPVPQDDSLVTYAARIRTADAALDWRSPATVLDRIVRAYNPVPGAWFMLEDARIKCWRARVTAAVDAPPGTVVTAGPDGITVACGEGALTLLSLQRPGKRPIAAGEFAGQFELIGRQL